MTLPALSFEFFPPKTEDGRHKLRSTWQQLARFEPDFFSVTFGAGGSSRDNTIDTVIAIQAEGHVAAPHLSCIASSEAQIRALLRKYQLHGIQRLVVLRGDMPSGEVGMGVFHHASDLVSFIRAETGTQFHLEVAAYPEFHPEASTPQDDIQHLKRKLAVGANGAITQYFYNVEAYFRLVEALEREGVTAVITPGIMPIYNIT
ncbi:MAG: methylenetetrahydrofolate reductase, partial [Methylophilaceae bacterium]|nr:methylenetetrahydrofolate reductase [Methylophilaceae bacterium]